MGEDRFIGSLGPPLKSLAAKEPGFSVRRRTWTSVQTRRPCQSRSNPCPPTGKGKVARMQVKLSKKKKEIKKKERT